MFFYGGNCNVVQPSSVDTYFNTYTLSCSAICEAGITLTWGWRLTGSYGQCGASTLYCPFVSQAKIKLNDYVLDPLDDELHEIVVHEMGHVLGLGEVPGSCGTPDFSIMSYNCVSL